MNKTIAGLTTEEIAHHIYIEIFGDIDSKRIYGMKMAEIQDWLTDGDLDGSTSLFELTREWRGFDKLFIERVGL